MDLPPLVYNDVLANIWYGLPVDKHVKTMILASGPQLVHQRLWYVFACLWENAYKKSLAVFREE